MRRNYFINKDLQSRFIMRFVVLATIWAAVTVMLFIYVAQKKLTVLCYSSYCDISTINELLLPLTIGVQVVTLVVFAGILAQIIHSLLKRLSPPLFAIKRSLAGIAGGDLASKVVLRKGDEFQDLAMGLDEMRASLREKILRIKEQQPALSAASTELSTSMLTGTPSLSSALSLQSAVERMKEEIRAFHQL
ncbi:MAG: hypothetical protein ACLQF0_04140 [Dissulfurispiraceae bacterium]